MMSADSLLSRLDKVKRTGPGKWQAQCPAHEDRGPSLAVRELDDGRLLLHCFAGCDVHSVLSAVSLDMAALFPERPIEHAPRERRPFFPQDVFEIARQEIGIVAVLAADMHANKLVSEADYERVFVAVERLNDIAGAAYGR